jgi:hypothetical protein
MESEGGDGTTIDPRGCCCAAVINGPITSYGTRNPQGSVYWDGSVLRQAVMSERKVGLISLLKVHGNPTLRHIVGCFQNEPWSLVHGIRQKAYF